MTILAWIMFVLAMVLVPISVWASLAALGVCAGCALVRDWQRDRQLESPREKNG
jgi:Flp pilus assembly protein TadB